MARTIVYHRVRRTSNRHGDMMPQVKGFVKTESLLTPIAQTAIVSPQGEVGKK